MEGIGRKKYKIKAFGVTREILGGRETIVEVAGQTVADLRNELLKNYPPLTSLRSLMIAVNNTYAEDSQILIDADEIALIPPVSGG
jgi:sulfur-carrier protein